MPTPSPEGLPGRQPTRRNKKAERFSEILVVAGRLFYERGYAQCTLSDIGDALDMHKASLYYYVSSKEELLEHVILHASARLREVAEETASHSGSPVELLERIVRNHVRVILEHRESFGVLIEQRRNIDPTTRERIEPRERRYLDTIRTLFKDLERSGLIKPADENLRLRMTVDMMNGAVRWHPAGAPIEATVEHVWRRVAMSLSLTP